MEHLLHGIAGVIGLVALAWLCSENRRAVPWRAVLTGLVLQAVLALLALRMPLVRDGFEAINRGLGSLEAATQAGTSLVFRSEEHTSELQSH